MEKEKNRGFSLLELIVVIAMIAVLGGILAGATGSLNGYRIRQCTEILDSFIRKTRTEAMAKNSVCGFCLYQKEGSYYVQSYGEEKAEGGAVVYKTAEVRKLGSSHGIEISVSKADGSEKQILEENEGDTIESCIRVKYASGTGAVEKITVGTDTAPKMDYTRITVSKGERAQWIRLNPATGRHIQN